MSTSPRTDFDASAKRHMADADLLHGHSRLENADHLAGIAAECALKALIAGFLGGHVSATDLVVRPDTNKELKQHVNALWPEMAVIIGSRTATSLVPLLANEPFADWTVNERYSDGSHLTPAAVADHLAAARDVVGILEQAHIDGVLQ